MTFTNTSRTSMKMDMIRMWLVIQIGQNYFSILKNFVIVPTDKSPQSLSIICPRLYLSRLQKKHEAYKDASKEDLAAAVAQFRELEKKHSLPVSSDIIPYSYLTPKFHKRDKRGEHVPDKWREIVGTSTNGFSAPTETANEELEEKHHDDDDEFLSSQTPGVPSSKVNYSSSVGIYLSHALQSVINMHAEMGKKMYALTKVKHFFCCSSTQETPKLFEAKKNDAAFLCSTTLCTSDYSEAYTAIDQESLIKHCSQAIDRAWTIAKDILANDYGHDFSDNTYELKLYVNKTGKFDGPEFVYVPCGDNSGHLELGLSCKDVKELLSVYVRGAFFANGNTLKRQSGGITIGGIPGPQLLNLCFVNVEWVHSECLVTNMKKDKDLQRRVSDVCGLYHVSRYVDDRLFPKACVPFIPSSKEYGLKISDVQDSHSVTFVGYRITCDPAKNSVAVTLADKAQKLHFDLVKYPHANTTMTNSTFVASYVNALFDAATVYSPKEFNAYASSVITELKLKRGYVEEWARKGVNKLCSSLWCLAPIRRSALKKDLLALVRDVYNRKWASTLATVGYVNTGSVCHAISVLHMIHVMLSYEDTLETLLDRSPFGTFTMDLIRSQDVSRSAMVSQNM